MSFGQSNEPGTIHVGLGWGLTLGGAAIDYTYTPVKGSAVTLNEKGVGFYSNYGVRGEYGLADRFSAGIYIRKEGGGFLVSSNDLSSSASSSSSLVAVSAIGFGAEGRFYAVNKDKFNFYLSPAIGFTTGTATDDNGGYGVVSSGTASGLNYGVMAGINWYFANFVGMSCDLGYSSAMLSGSFPADTDGSYSYKINSSGFFFGLGVAAKFGGGGGGGHHKKRR